MICLNEFNKDLTSGHVIRERCLRFIRLVNPNLFCARYFLGCRMLDPSRVTDARGYHNVNAATYPVILGGSLCCIIHTTFVLSFRL